MFEESLHNEHFPVIVLTAWICFSSVWKSIELFQLDQFIFILQLSKYLITNMTYNDINNCDRMCKILRYGGILILFIPAIVNVLVGAMVRINSLNCTTYEIDTWFD